MNEPKRKALYVCDPTKATGCKKTGCKRNPNAAYPECDRTSHVEWAALDADGRPILDERSDQYGKEITITLTPKNPEAQGG